MQSFIFRFKLQSVNLAATLRSGILAVVAVMFFFSLTVFAQQTDSDESPVVVQPGAPGQPTKILPPTTRAKSAAAFAEGCGVYAGYDYAPRAGGRDDGVDRGADGEQGTSSARSAHQPYAGGRNKFYETVARNQRRENFDADDGNVEMNMSEHSITIIMMLMPGMLTGRADGRIGKGKRRGV